MAKRLYRTAFISSLILAVYGVMPLLIFETASFPHALVGFVFLYLYIMLCWIFNIWLFKKVKKTAQRYTSSFLTAIGAQVLILLAMPKEDTMITSPSFFILPLLSTFVINSSILLLHNTILNQHLKVQAEKNAEKLEIANLKAEKRLLQQQLHPHFLFNSLSVIKSLVKINPDSAEQYTIQLSDFLRYSLVNHSRELNSVEEELLFSKSYLELQRMRFGNAIVFTEKIRQQDFSREIPIFSLQGLIENALKHNRFSEKKPLHITVRSDGNKLWVENNFLGKTRAESSGTGLMNLNKRYKLLKKEDIEIVKTASLFSVAIELI